MKDKEVRYLSVEQFAEGCGVNVQMVMKWIKSGSIKAEKCPGKKDFKIGIENFSKVKFEKPLRIESHFELQEKYRSKVLIVDDEKNIIESIAPVFSSHGFQVLSSTNIYEAMFMVNIEHPLILTLDLGMLDSNGTDILKMINDLGVKKNIWVIIISAASEPELQNAVNLGADFYLQKPFYEYDLDKIIKKLSMNLKVKAA